MTLMARNNTLTARGDKLVAERGALMQSNPLKVKTPFGNAAACEDSEASAFERQDSERCLRRRLLVQQWESEKQKYELKAIGVNVFAYMLKQNARGSAPPHWLCVRCFNDGHVEFIELARYGGRKYICPRCKATIEPSPAACADDGMGSPKWLD